MSEEYETGEQMTEAAAPVATEESEPRSEVSQEERNVPLDALQAERAERQKLQDELKMMRDHIALMQANQAQPQQKQKDEFDGLSEDDVLTVRDMKKALSEKEKQFNMTIQELKMTQKYPDYQQVVTEYLPEVLKQNPGLRETLVKSQDYELAYYLAKNSDSYKGKTKQVAKNREAQKILENSQKSGSLASVGQNSPINEAKRYRDMSDEDFNKTVRKNLGYF